MRYIICIYLTLNSLVSLSQDVDTIYVNNKYKTVVIFPNIINWVDINPIALQTNYVKEHSGITCLIAAKTDSIPPAELSVFHGNTLWNFTLVYKENITESERQYNFSQVTPSSNEPSADAIAERKANTESLADQLIEKRATLVEGNPNIENAQFGVKEGKLKAAAIVVRQDNEHYYFKIGLYNNNKEAFVASSLDMYFVDKDPSSGLVNREYATPLYSHFTGDRGSDDEYIVPSKGEKYIIYVIRKFKISKKGHIEITITENNSTKVLSFEISSEDLEKFNQF